MSRKPILCLGDPNTWAIAPVGGGRYDDDARWTERLARLLGDGFRVIAEGLNGRTTCFEDPINEGLSGLGTLAPILQSHAPLDLLILMLGTNDCKQRFSATPVNIKDGLLRLVQKARGLDVWRSQPRILIVAPLIMDKRLHEAPCAGGKGAGWVGKTRREPPP